MIRRLIILLLIVGCEEAGITSNGLTDGTAVTDTLYIFNYDTLIVINYDTLIITNYDTLIVIDTVYIDSEYVYGCTDANACNFNANATIFDMSCWYKSDSCECDDGEGAVTDNCDTCDSDTSNDCEQDHIVGTWELTALSGTYIRDVAVPAGTEEGTTYSLKVRWLYDTSDGYQADQTLKSYSKGDTLLNTTSDAGAYIVAGAVQLVGEFKGDDTYTFVGNYPALRIDVSACSTYQTITDIDDDGNYTIAYNANETGGTLGVTPKVGTEQVLPSFPDGTVTFSGTNADTLNIVFLDRDAHDSLITFISETWVEDDNRVTHGIAQAYVDATGNYFTSDDTQPLGTSGYLYDPLGNDGVPTNGDEALATWGYYYTYNAVMFNGCLAGGTDQATCAAAGYATNDSAHDFNPADATAGGKLTMEIVPVCIPANETILFDLTFGRQ